MAEDGHKVSLNVYDLSQGLARQLSSSILGKVIDGIWHTGVVVYGNEYYFGGGIQQAPVGTTPYGTPVRVIELGVTHVPKELFEEYLHEIGPRYTMESYSLLEHNCNNFSNEVSQFLVGVGIPEYILRLPHEVKSSPMGALILPMIQQLETTLRAGAVPQAPQFRPAAPARRAYTTSTSSTVGDQKAATTAAAAPETSANNKVESSSPSKETVGKQSAPSGGAPPAAAAAAADPLGDARSRVQEEITKEFVALMASGTLRASEAAALATRRVMQRYGGAATNVSAQ